MAGFRVWAVGEKVTAANLLSYLQTQVEGRFATSTARNTAVASVLEEGLKSYQLDANTGTMYDGSAWQEYYRNAARETFSPILNQSAGVTYTKNRATYSKSFREVRFDFDLTCTSAGSAGTDISIELPFTAPAAMVGGVIGNGFIYDLSATTSYDAHLVVTSTTYAKFLRIPGSAAGLLYIGNGVALTLASGDVVRGQGTYEAAA